MTDGTSEQLPRINIACDRELKDAIEREAYRRSEPGKSVSLSEVVRGVLSDEFLEEEQGEN